MSLLILCSGCPKDNDCQSNPDCPEGQYCGSDQVCTFDCRRNTDCPGGICNSLGKCVSALTDGGTLDGGGADSRPDFKADLASGSDASDLKAQVDLASGSDASDLSGDKALVDKGTVDAPAAGDAGDAAITEAGTPSSWVKVTAGKFYMGSSTSESCRDSTNETQHEVTLSKSFMISATEVTRAEFYAAMGYNYSKGSGCTSSCPVEYLTWSEAAAYCNALSSKAGATACYTCTGTTDQVSCSVASVYSGSLIYTCPGYRLPTEAEWEYAARAGTTSSLPNGSLTLCTGTDTLASQIAWYAANSSQQPHPVKGKQANAWGLYDMTGNVYEWVHDDYQTDLGSSAVSDPVGTASGTGRTAKGGSWYHDGRYLRPASRMSVTPTGRAAFLGFRCVKTAP